MKTNTIIPSFKLSENKINTTQNAIVDFYEEATTDYNFWSKDYNMHFGYYTFLKTNPFKRDSMLNELNNQVYKRFSLDKTKTNIVDLGCGMGGTMRYFFKKEFPIVNDWSYTLSISSKRRK